MPVILRPCADSGNQALFSPRQIQKSLGTRLSVSQSVNVLNIYCGPINLGLPESLSTHGRSQDRALAA